MDRQGIVVEQRWVGCWRVVALVLAALVVVARRSRIGSNTQKDIEALFGPD